MAERNHQLDELTADLIAARQVCPYIPGCNFYHLCNRPDQNSLYYATHFCGDKFILCQVYKARMAEQGRPSEVSDLPACASRASPTRGLVCAVSATAPAVQLLQRRNKP